MVSFVQLNLQHFVALVTLVVVWCITVVVAPKEAFKLISGVVFVIVLGVLVSMAYNTLYNQVPKREIDRSYVDQGVIKYQQSIQERK